MTTEPVEETERWLRALASELTMPAPGECLLCFIHRELDEFGCDCTLRFAQRYRDLRVPRATALEQRLARLGGFCDCEVFMNGYTLHPRWWTPEREVEREDGWTDIEPAEPPARLPECSGVGPRTTEPCALWVRQGRRW